MHTQLHRNRTDSYLNTKLNLRAKANAPKHPHSECMKLAGSKWVERIFHGTVHIHVERVFDGTIHAHAERVFDGTVHAVLKWFFMEQFMLCWNIFFHNSCLRWVFFVEQFMHGIMPLLKVFVCGAIYAPVERVFHGSNSCSCLRDFSWNNSCPCWKFFMGQFTPVLKMF